MKHLILKKRASLLLAFSLVFFTSCAHLIYLDQAQNAMNKAATMGNSAQLADINEQFSDKQVDAASQLAQEKLLSEQQQTYYQLAYGQINKALQKKGELRRNKVLPLALSMKAMCEWKMNMENAAEESAKDALDAMKDDQVRLPRDQAVMEAMPALIATENAFDHYNAIKEMSDGLIRKIRQSGALDPAAAKEAFSNAKKLYAPKGSLSQNDLSAALNHYDKAQKVNSLDESVRFYLFTSQLGATKTWYQINDRLNDMITNIHNNLGTVASAQDTSWISQEKMELVKDRCAYQQRRNAGLQQFADLLKAGNVADTQNSIISFWREELVDSPEGCQ